MRYGIFCCPANLSKCLYNSGMLLSSWMFHYILLTSSCWLGLPGSAEGIKSWRHSVSSYFLLHQTAAWHLSWQSSCNIFHSPQLPKATCTTSYPQTTSIMKDNLFLPASESAALAVDMKNMNFLVRNFYQKCKEFYAFWAKNPLQVIINTISH